jgi:hypothetical protein
MLHISNFKYFFRFPPICASIVDLDKAKKTIDELNTIMECKNFKISINYGFQMEKNTEIATLFAFESAQLLLCIFYDNNCVASLAIEYIDGKIIIDSKTKNEYEGKKLNKLLRSVVIIIAKQLYPNAV